MDKESESTETPQLMPPNLSKQNIQKGLIIASWI